MDRPVDPGRDHVLGLVDAPVTLVEYGGYACPHCRAANDRIAEVRNQLGDRLRYVFRHRPIPGNELGRRAAELVEQIESPERFWDAHVALMSRSLTLVEDDLQAVAREFGIDGFGDAERARRAKARVEEDERSARASGVTMTPTFFINGRRFFGPWDERAFTDAMLGTLGHRVRVAALEFASWAPSAGLLLLLASLLAIVLTNSAAGASFTALWEVPFGFTLGDKGFYLPLKSWVNDGLLTLFFLVVGLEIKREFTVGHLASRRSAALPVAAAIGGMVVPAVLYVLMVPDGSWSHGWGVPMATDTAFAIALIATMGRRVPVELRIFLTAAAIVDDIGAILVVAIFYSGDLRLDYLSAAIAITGVLIVLNQSHVYRVSPYLVLGAVLWACVHAGGLHATLAGVVLAIFIPTRPPPDFKSLSLQADAILTNEASHGGEVYRRGPSETALRELDAIFDRLESPAARLLRNAGPQSSYIVLPIFALANAGVIVSIDVLEGRETLVSAIVVGLVAGKPVGMALASLLAVQLGIAVKPAAYSWRQLWGAGALAGIGFTMSLFIAAQAFPVANDFSAAKLAVFAASILSAVIGSVLLWNARAPAPSPAR
ncbi:MAG TPA: Na+/H+ antiporter NhaA [Woeseiaceae bacterium]|nr:Na+/H+ antiporter NhaA [Woeseiaceae bacterium]